MTQGQPAAARQPPEYDEFGLLADNAAEAGLPWTGQPAVHREFVDVDPRTPGQQVSALG